MDAWRKVVGVKDVSQKKGPLSVLKESAAKLLLKVGFSLGKTAGYVSHRVCLGEEGRDTGALLHTEMDN